MIYILKYLFILVSLILINLKKKNVIKGFAHKPS